MIDANWADAPRLAWVGAGQADRAGAGGDLAEQRMAEMGRLQAIRLFS